MHEASFSKIKIKLKRKHMSTKKKTIITNLTSSYYTYREKKCFQIKGYSAYLKTGTSK